MKFFEFQKLVDKKIIRIIGVEKFESEFFSSQDLFIAKVSKELDESIHLKNLETKLNNKDLENWEDYFFEISKMIEKHQKIKILAEIQKNMV